MERHLGLPAGSSIVLITSLLCGQRKREETSQFLNFWDAVVSHQYLPIFLIYSPLVEKRIDKGRRQKEKVRFISSWIYT